MVLLSDQSYVLAGIPPDLDMSVLLYVILGAAAGLKVLLYLYCVALQKSSETMVNVLQNAQETLLLIKKCRPAHPSWLSCPCRWHWQRIIAMIS